jgi:orotate phosphoribosyltransferase
MIDHKALIAQMLLEIEAVHYYTSKPFVLTSGTLSPVYVDIRRLISFPSQRKTVLAVAHALIGQALSGEKFDVIAGGETAGIPYAAWLADQLTLPMIYVRKAAKGFGRESQIEGRLPKGSRVLLVEDLLFDAQSKINFCQAIRREGAQVEHVLVVFDYGSAASKENLAKHSITAHALCDWPTLLAVGEERGHFSADQVNDIRAFLADPKKWSDARQVALSEPHTK